MHTGVEITEVEVGLQGEKLGIQIGDTVVSYNGTPVSTAREIGELRYHAKTIGLEKVEIQFWHQGTLVTKEALITEALGINGKRKSAATSDKTGLDSFRAIFAFSVGAVVIVGLLFTATDNSVSSGSGNSSSNGSSTMGTGTYYQNPNCQAMQQNIERLYRLQCKGNSAAQCRHFAQQIDQKVNGISRRMAEIGCR